jgi:hypothetical protein
MTIKVTYTARGDKIHGEGTRFVRAVFTNDREATSNDYAWCIRSNRNKMYDLQQGTCNASDLPVDIRKAADRKLGHAISYVEWPK